MPALQTFLSDEHSLRLTKFYVNTALSDVIGGISCRFGIPVSKYYNMTSIRPGMEGNQTVSLPEGKYGVPDMMMHGFQNASGGNAPVHPLEFSEKNWHENRKLMDFQMLRNMQGLHAPLRLQMELNVASKMRRLPGLASSRVLENSLTGRDMLLDFEDVFNDADEMPQITQPHIQMEKKLHIL
ncbi:proteasome maturation protein-like [Mya arenaria]|uniref:proteasome maturation protein-like n=1 Tax=Mya arenaria TaxID=6604 RepID=UPI0022E67B35|nr:proteasome maturation protein-like [Mya arenaria]